MTAPESVDAYLAALPAGPREALEAVRRIILTTAPGAAEVIAYGIPTYRVNGRMLVSIAAFARHCSIFPASGAVMDALGEELRPYFRERATLRFRPDDPIPESLVVRLLRVRLAEIEGPPAA